MHKLSNVDIVGKTAICAVCGPVKIRVRDTRHGHQCMNLRKDQTRRWFKTPKGKESLKRAQDKIRAKRKADPSFQTEPHRKHLKPKCERCGFDPANPCQLDVHHLDGNHRNNDPLNLMTLCANCHRLVHSEGFNDPRFLVGVVVSV